VARSDADSRRSCEKASACRSRSLRRCHKSANAKWPNGGKTRIKRACWGRQNVAAGIVACNKKSCLQVEATTNSVRRWSHAPWAIPLPSHLTIKESICVCLEAHREGALRGSHTIATNLKPVGGRHASVTPLSHPSSFLHFFILLSQPRFVLGLAVVPFLDDQPCVGRQSQAPNTQSETVILSQHSVFSCNSTANEFSSGRARGVVLPES